MSKEGIEIGIGGSNKDFVAVMADTEQKAKATAEKVAAALDKATAKGIRGKLGPEINALAGDLSKLTSLSGAFELGLSKIGTGLKMAGVVGLVGALGKGIYDATMEVNALDRVLERMYARNRGGVGNFSMSDLTENFNAITDKRNELRNQNADPLGRLGGTVVRHLANWGNVLAGGEPKNDEQVNSDPEIKDEKLKVSQGVGLERIAEKQGQIWKIEQARLNGDREGAEIDKVRAEFAERKQDAVAMEKIAASENTSLQNKLKEEEQGRIEVLEKINAISLHARVTSEAGAAMRAGNATRAVGMSAEEAERQSRGANLINASNSADDAKRESEAFPADKDRASKAVIAARDAESVNAENAKWERDISRSKRDQLQSITAQIDAANMTMRGHALEADLMIRRVNSEQAATKAVEAGNVELAARIKQLNQINELGQRRGMAIDPVTGKSRSQHSQMDDVISNRRMQNETEKSNKRFDDRDGLLNAHRDINGKITDGIDPMTGKRVDATHYKEMKNASETAKKSAEKLKSDDAKADRDSKKGILDVAEILKKWDGGK